MRGVSSGSLLSRVSVIVPAWVWSSSYPLPLPLDVSVPVMSRGVMSVHVIIDGGVSAPEPRPICSCVAGHFAFGWLGPALVTRIVAVQAARSPVVPVDQDAVSLAEATRHAGDV